MILTETAKTEVIIMPNKNHIKDFPRYFLDFLFKYIIKFLIPPETKAKGLVILNFPVTEFIVTRPNAVM